MDFMDENRGEVTFGTTKGLRPFYKCLNSQLCLTLAPKSGDSTNVQGIIRNLLARMSNEGDPFSVVDFLWEEIQTTSHTPSRSCAYVPYIMFMIEKVTKKNFFKEVKHEPYRVRLVG